MAAKYDLLSSMAKEGVKTLDKKAAPASKEYKEAEEALLSAYQKAVKLLNKRFEDKLTLKQPSAAKLLPLMQKTGKPVEFKLCLDGSKLSLVAEVGGNQNTVGILDPRLLKQRTVIESLVEAGLEDKSALAEFDKASAEAVKGVDKKVVERELTKRKAEALAGKKVAEDKKQKLTKSIGDWTKVTVAQALAIPVVLKELEAFAKSEHNDENIKFLVAVKNNASAKAIIDDFHLTDEKAPDINLPASMWNDLKKSIVDKKPDFQPAYREIAKLVEKDTMVRFHTAKRKELEPELKGVDERLSRYEKELVSIEKQLKSL